MRVKLTKRYKGAPEGTRFPRDYEAGQVIEGRVAAAALADGAGAETDEPVSPGCEISEPVGRGRPPRRAERDQAHAPAAENQVGDQAGGAIQLDQAQAEAADIIAKATAEAGEIVAAAKAQAGEIVQTANGRASDIVAKARAAAQRIAGDQASGDQAQGGEQAAGGDQAQGDQAADDQAKPTKGGRR